MKRNLLLLALAILTTTIMSAQPAIVRQDGTTHFEIDGKPFLMLTGELHNSTSTSASYMDQIGVWKLMKDNNFNTVIASCSWDVIEKEEGKYDFSSMDHVITSARANGLKVVMIWFATWKNGNSTYAPSWIKTNPKKYPLVQTEDGRYLNVVSTFSDAAKAADKKAFVALMKHIKEADFDNTVIMMQVENEVGILGSPRDYSAPAQKAFKAQVPAEVMTYLQAHKGALHPQLEKVWSANGYKTKGTWEEVFGKSLRGAEEESKEFPYFTEQLFQAYQYSKFVNEIVVAGKAAHNIPMYINTWLRVPGQANQMIPGQFPSGGPLPELHDIWRVGAPDVDLFAPDVYQDDYEWVMSEYSRSGNPIFVPECRVDAAKALFSFGEHDALGFAPFGFDGPQRGAPGEAAENMANLGKVYGILAGMDQMVVAAYGSDRMRGLRLTADKPSKSVEMGDYVVTVRSSVRAQEGQPAVQSGALILQTAPDEFILVAINASFSFAQKDPKAKGSVLYDLIEEGTFKNGQWIPGRNLNGDEYRVSINGVGAEKVHVYKSLVN